MSFEPFVTTYTNFCGVIVPSTYNGWRAETNAWKDSCYISGNLSSLMCVHTVKCPDAVCMMNENFVNKFTNMPVGAVQHGILPQKQPCRLSPKFKKAGTPP